MLSKEEMESKYVNVVSASLLSLCLFLQIVSKEDHAKVTSNFNDILVNPKFWKLGKHKDIKVILKFASSVDSLKLRVYFHAVY